MKIVITLLKLGAVAAVVVIMACSEETPLDDAKGKVPAFIARWGCPGRESGVLRLVAMSESDVIDVTQLPSAMRFRVVGGAGLDRTLEEVEIEHIVRVLESVGGNKSRAAKILGINVKTLREKLKRRSVGL